MSDTETPAPVSLFYSYAHEDEPLRIELVGHLKILERRGLVSQWHDRQIQPGEDWHSRISDELQTALVVSTPLSLRYRRFGWPKVPAAKSRSPSPS